MARKFLVTGGSGFIGSALVRCLIEAGHMVRVLDDNSRGSPRRLAGLEGRYEMTVGDIRDPATTRRAMKGIDCCCHLAAINGTGFFYSKPELVLEVAVKGILNVIDACVAEGVGDLVLASSSEVYQTPPAIPTDESAPLVVPDPMNPRYSYGGGKIISELLALNWGRKHFERVAIFRPHNIYGPDMGWEHVLPQFVLRMKALSAAQPAGTLNFPIQGSGNEIRAFCYIDDFIDGLARVIDKGEHLSIYHIGTDEEVTIADVARLIARFFGREIDVVPGELQKGGALRRCPDISKLRKLGYAPQIALAAGLPSLARWYDVNAQLAPKVG